MALGPVLDTFSRGRMPAEAGGLVDRIFGKAGKRGSLVVSGANGIVGAGKSMQLGSRLLPYDVHIVGLDFPNAPDGIGRQYPGLVTAFGKEDADRIMSNVIRLSYDGAHLPVFSSNSKHIAYIANEDKKFFVVADGRPGPQYDNIIKGGPIVHDDGIVEYLAKKEQTIYRVKHTPVKE